MERRAVRSVLAVALLYVTPVWAEDPVGSPAAPSANAFVSVHGTLTTVFANVDSATGIGAGVAFQKTVVPESLLKIRGIHKDDIGIEVEFERLSVSYTIYAYYPGVTYRFPASASALLFGLSGVWNIWLNERIAFYPKLGLIYADFGGDIENPGGQFGVDAAAGCVLKVGPIQLKGEAGYLGFRLGAGVAF